MEPQLTKITIEGITMDIILSRAVLEMFPNAYASVRKLIGKEGIGPEVEAESGFGNLITIHIRNLNYLIDAHEIVQLVLWYAHHADQREEYLAPDPSLADLIGDVSKVQFKGEE